MENEDKLALTALTEFKSGNYESSLQALDKLTAMKPNDYKITHNKSVVEFYSSKQSNVDAFQKTIAQLSSQHHINMSDGPEDVEHCIIFYNQAILHYIQKQYDKALSITEKVYSLIQPMDEYLARKVCLLLLELNILNNQVEKALSLMSQIEDQFLSTESKTLKFDKEAEPEEKPAPLLDEATEAFRISFLHLRAKCHITTGAYDLAKKDIDTVFTAKKESFSTIMLKAQLESLQKNYIEAEKTLIVVQQDIENFEKLGEVNTFLYYNNMSTIQHNLGKPGLCKFFITKGFNVFKNACEKYSKLGPKELIISRPSVFRPQEVIRFIYNMGVALLYAGYPTQAFDYFTEAVQVMHTSPLMWLRLAECCIMAYKADNKYLFDFSNKRKELAVESLGAGPFRKILLNDQLYKNMSYSCEPQSYAIPVASMEFASLCVRNAWQLLPKENCSKLKHSVLAASAFIRLTIGDFVLALKDGNKLLEDESCSDMYKYLARLYIGEALVMLDRVPEAIETLSFFKELDPCHEKLLYQWYPRSETAASTVLQYNLAAALCIQGELEKASNILKLIWVNRGTKNEVPMHVVALALYIELVLGRPDTAKTIIKQNCPQII